MRVGREVGLQNGDIEVRLRLSRDEWRMLRHAAENDGVNTGKRDWAQSYLSQLLIRKITKK